MDGNEKKQYYLVVGRSPVYGLQAPKFESYITTSDEFKSFCKDMIDLDAEGQEVNATYSRYIRHISKVSEIGKTEFEDRAIQGIERTFQTEKGLVKIGFTRIREDRIYVQFDDRYLRGFKVFFADLCLVNSMDFVPLDKSMGDGNIEIIEWNKRKSTKAVRFIHNKVQSLLYVVDMEFMTFEDMEKDMETPQEVNIRAIIEPLLMG